LSAAFASSTKGPEFLESHSAIEVTQPRPDKLLAISKRFLLLKPCCKIAVRLAFRDQGFVISFDPAIDYNCQFTDVAMLYEISASTVLMKPFGARSFNAYQIILINVRNHVKCK